MKGFWKRKLPACLLALALLAGTMPTASAASYVDFTYQVDADDDVRIWADDFEDLFYDWSSDDFYYVDFTDIDDFDDYGYFTADDEDGHDAKLDTDALDYGYFYIKSRNAQYSGDYDLNTLYFMAYDDADSTTLSFDFTIYGEDDDEVDGTFEIEIEGGSKSSSGDVELTYYVDPDDDVEFDAGDFKELFDEESRETFEYLDFYGYDDFDGYGYFKAKDADGDWTELNEDDLEDGYYYYDWNDTYSWYDYALDGMTFYADKYADEDTLEFPFTMYGDDDDRVDGTLYIEIGKGSGTSKGDITYQVSENGTVTFDRDDFWEFLDDETGDDLEYVRFTDASGLDDWGELYSYDYDDDRVYFDEGDLDDGYFYYNSKDLYYDDDYTLDDLTFSAGRNTNGKTVTLSFTAHGEDGDSVRGTVKIQIGKGTGTTTKVEGDIIYKVDPNDDVVFDADDFWDFLDDEADDDLEYVVFTDYSDFDDCGYFEADGYDYDDYVRDYELNESDLDYAYFYYDPDDAEDDYDFELDTLTFYADRDADGEVVTLEFTAYGRYDDAKGTVAIAIGDVDTGASADGGDIRYYGSYSSRVQINANDISRFFQESYPGYTLQYVTIDDVPEAGTLYYNYYGTSQYGSSYNLRMTDSLCDELDFHFSPTSSQYALSELTYVPSGVNYCAHIPFTAHGTGSRSVSGTILISVNLSEVPDVYGPTPVNTSVNFPAASIATAVSQASGLTLSSIQLLELPAANEGTIYEGTGTSQRADTDTLYGYTSGNVRISQLRFVPASGFTGSVEIPYVACNASGDPIASGKLCLGVVRQMEDFSDITSSTWCYKYVLELSDAGVIDGYDDGTFKPNNQVTYGAALKLIMLAAGYAEQAPTGSNVFSGYLARAQEDGLVSGSVNLSAPITRLAVSQIAAKALGLNITNLSSVRPFTDTTDPYVQALNAAGIVEGYFSNGTSTFKPYNTLTRGQISAIVWRMEQLG